VLARVVMRVKKAVRRLALRPDVFEAPSGTDNELSWREMLARVDAQEREIEQRLARAEKALNRLSLP
jgi:hypothetical protein